MTVRSRLPPDSTAKSLAHRLRMATAARSLNGGDRASRAVATALRTTALGRLSAEEDAWATRIEDRRREIGDLAGVRTPDQVGVYDIRLAVQWMSVPPTLGRLLLRLVRELVPRSCIELGTGFGISAAYQAAGLELAGDGRLVTVDLDPRPAAIAREGLSALGLARAEVRAGGPEVTLAALAELDPVDFAFVDSDHRGMAIARAFETMLPHLGEGAVILFDDVAPKWAGMRRAWEAIGAGERVAWTRHLGRLGVVAMRDA